VNGEEGRGKDNFECQILSFELEKPTKKSLNSKLSIKNSKFMRQGFPIRPIEPIEPTNIY
jgi:hypothetical protein